MAAALILFHFFLPFFMLLMRAIKDRPKTIAIVTVIILVMRFVDIYWLVAPGASRRALLLLLDHRSPPSSASAVSGWPRSSGS